ncbi:outer membrane lipoprotein-sorting protein [candidate division KSB1 bacterium]|nr:MAG: outer membrane lipoprotein-sorting protein [candidate division KSB1 bacterium]
MRRLWYLCIFLNFFYSGFSIQKLTGDDIIKRVNDTLNQDTVYGKMKMTIITTSGKKRTFIYESFSKNKGEKNLIRYIEPSRVRGQATLLLNNADDIWVYFPRTKRVRKLATHAKKQKMEGSDFSYEDLGSGDSFIKNFTAKRLKDEKKEGFDCYKIELTKKKGSDSGYSRIIVWVIKENFFPVVISYYDENDPDLLLKELVQKDIRMVDNVPTAMKMVMYNRLDNTQTTMEILSVKYNVKLDDKMFTERGLRK